MRLSIELKFPTTLIKSRSSTPTNNKAIHPKRFFYQHSETSVIRKCHDDTHTTDIILLLVLQNTRFKKEATI